MMRVLASLAAAAVVLAACSGVPSSSSPQVIGGVVGGPSGALPTNTPQPNAEPRAIVQEFLRANATEPLEPRGAREFLTPDVQRRWSDTTVTILQGSVEDAHVDVAKASGSHTTVLVKGTQIGSLNAAGEYTPVLNPDQASWSHDYSLDLVKGQSRINNPTDGLVVYAADFAQVYQTIRLYFPDLREKRLVPDVRYTALSSNKAALASWALNQLTIGPRLELTNAVRTEVPSLPPATPPSVVLEDLTASVELPGISHLESDVKVTLAAQLLATLDGVQPGVQLSLTDGHVPVAIPGLTDPISKDDITRVTPQAGPSAQAHFFDAITDPPLFYIDGTGRLVTRTGKPLDGPLGTHPEYNLNSVAITSARSDSDYYVAACVGSDSQQTLWVGRAGVGLNKVVGVPSGRLTRPSWLAGQREVWIANGANLYRVDYRGAVQAVPTTLSLGATITAMRLSPEGSRIAMIVHDGGQSRLWVGSIVRSDTIETQGSTARVEGALAILPPTFRLTDVAWGDDMTLWVVGSAGTENNVWSVNVDGSGLQEHGSSGLPQVADSITVGHSLPAWVSAGGYVFVGGTDWEGPGRHTTRGRNPIYQDSYLD